MNPLVLWLAARGWLPGTARWAGAHWAAWTLAFASMAALLGLSARQWHELQRLQPAAAVAEAPAASPRRAPSASDEVLQRLHITDAKATALSTLQQALEGTPGVQLVSTEFSLQPGAADRLDRTDMTLQLRGPYAGIKQVLAQWSARFETASLVSLRLQRNPTTAGVVDATAVAALWTRPAPAATPDAASASASTR